MKKITLFACVLFLTTFCKAQKWMEMIQDPSVNFHDIKKEFETYWADKEYLVEKLKLSYEGKAELTQEEKSLLSGWKQYKRWEWFTEQRVYPTGVRQIPEAIFQLQQNQKSSSVSAANWSYLGPITVPNYNNPPYTGAWGRVNCVRIDPNNSNIMYCGTPGGGVWKSVNKGVSWTVCNTDNLPALGISDIAIDPSNSQVIYLATGDCDGGSNYSIGVLKSTDGGLTWNTTGMTYSVTSPQLIKRIMVDPSSPQTIHVGGTNGIWRSTNGGTSFTQISTVGVRDMEFKPGNPSVVYAAGFGTILRSINSGLTYVTTNTLSGASRIALAVTPGDTNLIYALAATSSGTYNGLYRSLDAGTTFSLMSNSPDIIFGQGYYNLAIAASPTNTNEIVTGGISMHRSLDAGVTWSLCAPPGTNAHADTHDLVWFNDTTVYAASDGGVYESVNNGVKYATRSNGLFIAELYRLGQSVPFQNLILTGWQDNGTALMNGLTWDKVIGADGMECFIDRTNTSIMYADMQYSWFMRSTNAGSSFSNIMTGLTGSGAWCGPWQQDPAVANTLWCGWQQVYKSTNQGTNWVQAGTIAGSQVFIALKVAPSNNQVVYAARQTAIYRSTDGGSTWVNITAGLPVSSSNMTYIEVDNLDPNHVYVTFSGYSSGNKIFESTNSGSTWTNYSNGLPNLPVNCIVFENGSADAVYAGTDVGVYYRDATMSSWVNYSAGLPNVIVNELEIHYGGAKLRAATFGRGLWQSDLYSAPTSVKQNFNCEPGCLLIYPNPTYGDLTVEIEDERWNDAELEIKNVLGQKILSMRISDRSLQHINLSSMGKGIYFVSVSKGEMRWSKKIVVM